MEPYLSDKHRMAFIADSWQIGARRTAHCILIFEAHLLVGRFGLFLIARRKISDEDGPPEAVGGAGSVGPICKKCKTTPMHSRHVIERLSEGQTRRISPGDKLC